MHYTHHVLTAAKATRTMGRDNTDYHHQKLHYKRSDLNLQYQIISKASRIVAEIADLHLDKNSNSFTNMWTRRR
jgi:hypothetical protein